MSALCRASTKPGATTLPVTSMVRSAGRSRRSPISTICEPTDAYVGAEPTGARAVHDVAACDDEVEGRVIIPCHGHSFSPLARSPFGPRISPPPPRRS